MTTSLRKQQGISAMIVVVLIVLFALLGTYMLSMSSLSSIGTTQSASAMQAWFATRSGVEWAIHRSLAASDGGCSCATNCCTGIDGQTVSFSGGGISGYSANVSCAARDVTEGGANYCVYDLGVTATNNSSGTLTSVSRSISLSISDRNAP